MKAKDYNELLKTIKDTNDMTKEKGQPLQKSLRASIISDYGIADDDVKVLLKKMRWV